MNIALFGGAFDPPHVGHKLVAESLLKEQIVDEVWFVPVFTHPWAERYGKHTLTAYEHRVKMLELTITADISEVTALTDVKEQSSGVQQHQKQQKVAHYKSVSFTFDTLEYFSKEYPEHVFSWVMGSEYLDRFDDFLKGHPQLLKYHFYIYPRAGYPFAEQYKKENMTFLYDMPEVSASSTEIKELLHSGSEITDLVVPAVLEYIANNSLYTL